jgi:hypothetical protein
MVKERYMKTRLVVDDIGDLDVIFYIEEALTQYIDYYKNGGVEEDKHIATEAEKVYNLIHERARYRDYDYGKGE